MYPFICFFFLTKYISFDMADTLKFFFYIFSNLIAFEMCNICVLLENILFLDFFSQFFFFL